MQPTIWDFQNRVMAILNSARQSGKRYVDVQSSSLHNQVGEQPRSSTTLPLCCRAMKTMMKPGDSILQEGTGDGDAGLVIRYCT